MGRALLLLALAACGGAAPHPVVDRDPHRLLNAGECGELYDFMKGHGWLQAGQTPREEVVKACVGSRETTRAYYDCVMGSDTIEEADRCR
jgi:hypothetical protein